MSNPLSMEDSIRQIMDENPELVEQAEQGVGCLAAISGNLFGSDLKDSRWHEDKSRVELLFNALMSLEIPPDAVFMGDSYFAPMWYPNGRYSITCKEHYAELYIQFWNYLNSIRDKELGLEILFEELKNTYHSDDDYVVDKVSPFDFTRENFGNHECIIFMEFWGNMNQYALKYDADGKVVYANDDGGYFRA